MSDDTTFVDRRSVVEATWRSLGAVDERLRVAKTLNDKDVRRLRRLANLGDEDEWSEEDKYFKDQLNKQKHHRI